MSAQGQKIASLDEHLRRPGYAETSNRSAYPAADHPKTSSGLKPDAPAKDTTHNSSPASQASRIRASNCTNQSRARAAPDGAGSRTSGLLTSAQPRLLDRAAADQAGPAVKRGGELLVVIPIHRVFLCRCPSSLEPYFGVLSFGIGSKIRVRHYYFGFRSA